MNIDVYILSFMPRETILEINHPDLSEAAVHSLDLNAESDLPAAVIRAMSLRGADTFPLTVVDGHVVKSGAAPTREEIDSWKAQGVTESVALVTEAKSAVDFNGAARVHISLDVADVAASIPFYSVLFDCSPSKVKDDYAKFEPEEPSLNLSINQHEEITSSSGHYGIQVKSTAEVENARTRLASAGFVITEESETACCYAVQTKIWVVDPDGNMWEVFVVTEAEADEGCGPDCICFQELERSYVQAPEAFTTP
ncbi:ArsI/CadI family heavy metal resistance metalloenzyme [Actinomyces bowdenii]|uniref:Arsenic metallochaperone ArsD family protein n=1 Tax=Actinomyces bowdenii TaxID=131109 RepID=A0A853EG17_9ACTO|nr:ArsI/CadI family heavy metal resistance metalloenzyme [Actinomyces bowdenii]MBF0696066.1 arsenic metallochaperone ArsD family protein [Actinomyces bowdenii]MDO5064848.1 ArsI/CadI family heavy metal resistance metalloenzyme [Actinomyces bowdenii]NYS68239.1 arsenic metallochaperone ArsD family protein [Actinomyces bowdenii]